MNVMFMKVHQPNMPAPEFEGKSLSKSKYADSVVESLDMAKSLGAVTGPVTNGAGLTLSNGAD